MILSTQMENFDTIDGYTNKYLIYKTTTRYQRQIRKQMNLLDYLPEVDEMGQKVVELNDKMPELKEQAKIILDLQQKKIQRVQDAGRQIAEIDNDFSSIEETMNQGIEEAKQGLTIIQQVQDILPDVKI